MKQLLIICIICSMNIAQAQPYKPLLDDFNEWHFTTCFAGCNTSVYYTNGDTVMGGENWKVLDGYHYMSRTYFLKENVNSRQVFLAGITPSKVNHFLLYDFSKSEGDTMEIFNPSTPFLWNPGYFQLDSIRLHPLEDGLAYRHFYWSPTPSNTTSSDHPVWVEGVGSLSLITAAGGQPDFNGVGQLNCFFKNSDAFYVNLDSITSCEPIHVLGMEEHSSVEKLIVYPNPLTNELKLLGEFPEQKYQVLTLQGQLVQEGTISNKGSVSVEFLPVGYYLLQMNNRKAPFTKQ